jgi:hypothetical protein
VLLWLVISTSGLLVVSASPEREETENIATRKLITAVFIAFI